MMRLISLAHPTHLAPDGRPRLSLSLCSSRSPLPPPPRASRRIRTAALPAHRSPPVSLMSSSSAAAAAKKEQLLKEQWVIAPTEPIEKYCQDDTHRTAAATQRSASAARL